MAEIQSQVIDGPLGVVLAAGFMTCLAIAVMVVISVRKEGRKFERFEQNPDDDSWWST
jgi:hypothetical protein